MGDRRFGRTTTHLERSPFARGSVGTRRVGDTGIIKSGIASAVVPCSIQDIETGCRGSRAGFAKVVCFKPLAGRTSTQGCRDDVEWRKTAQRVLLVVSCHQV